MKKLTLVYRVPVHLPEVARALAEQLEAHYKLKGKASQIHGSWIHIETEQIISKDLMRDLHAFCYGFMAALNIQKSSPDRLRLPDGRFLPKELT